MDRGDERWMRMPVLRCGLCAGQIRIEDGRRFVCQCKPEGMKVDVEDWPENAQGCPRGVMMVACEKLEK